MDEIICFLSVRLLDVYDKAPSKVRSRIILNVLCFAQICASTLNIHLAILKVYVHVLSVAKRDGAIATGQYGR